MASKSKVAAWTTKILQGRVWKAGPPMELLLPKSKRLPSAIFGRYSCASIYCNMATENTQHSQMDLTTQVVPCWHLPPSKVSCQNQAALQAPAFHDCWCPVVWTQWLVDVAMVTMVVEWCECFRERYQKYRDSRNVTQQSTARGTMIQQTIYILFGS